MTVEWKPQARADLRRLPRDQAQTVLHAITRYGETGQGDVKRLRPPDSGLRLRVGDWRVRFAAQPGGLLCIQRVLHRSEAYR
jgi:mRNA-degrading endonuclease RelE of RelBE toxin-antitoxin system